MIGSIVFYTWLFMLAFGAFVEWRERPLKRSPNIGRRAARANKARATFVPRSTPVRHATVEAEPIATPVKPAPAKKSQLELDVASALVNLGYKKRDAAKVVSIAREQVQGCNEFETLLRAALQIKI